MSVKYELLENALLKLLIGEIQLVEEEVDRREERIWQCDSDAANTHFHSHPCQGLNKKHDDRHDSVFHFAYGEVIIEQHVEQGGSSGITIMIREVAPTRVPFSLNLPWPCGGHRHCQ